MVGVDRTDATTATKEKRRAELTMENVKLHYFLGCFFFVVVFISLPRIPPTDRILPGSVWRADRIDSDAKETNLKNLSR